MDSLAQLALMGKATRIFENTNTFLSFPVLTPISYKADQLDFDPAHLTNERLLALSEFSRAVNSCPSGPIFEMSSSTFLWDLYGELLASATIARNDLPGDDSAEYQQALELTQRRDEQGLVNDSTEMQAYRQYRDAFIRTTEDYKAQELTAVSSDDPAVKATWTNTEEPRMRALTDRAEGEWRSKGYREPIEHALQVLKAHSSRLPLTSWNQWKARFDPLLDQQTDATTIQFAPTPFAPQGIFPRNDWMTFHLSRSEIESFAQQAPQELKEILGGEPETSPVESLSFEYRSVTLSRAWFQSELFDARFWRLPDESIVISDGEGKGSWPAYVTALVFARNLNVTLRIRGPISIPHPSAGPLLRATGGRLPIRFGAPWPQTAFPPAGSALGKSRSGEVPIRMENAMSAASAIARSRVSPPIPGSSPAAPAVIASKPMLRPALLREVFRPLPTAPNEHTQSDSPPTDVAAEPGGAHDEIHILAFICKRIPMCPNPDPRFTW